MTYFTLRTNKPMKCQLSSPWQTATRRKHSRVATRSSTSSWRPSSKRISSTHLKILRPSLTVGQTTWWRTKRIKSLATIKTAWACTLESSRGRTSRTWQSSSSIPSFQSQRTHTGQPSPLMTMRMTCGILQRWETTTRLILGSQIGRTILVINSPSQSLNAPKDAQMTPLLSQTPPRQGWWPFLTTRRVSHRVTLGVMEHWGASSCRWWTTHRMATGRLHTAATPTAITILGIKLNLKVTIRNLLIKVISQISRCYQRHKEAPF